MAKDPYAPNRHGLVPVVMLVSEAGMGLRKGEIRGVPPAVAKKMCEKGNATTDLTQADNAKRSLAKELAQDDKGVSVKLTPNAGPPPAPKADKAEAKKGAAAALPGFDASA